MSDTINRQAAIDVVDKYDFEFPQYMEKFVTELRDAMKADLKCDIANLSSAEKTQLSEEDATKDATSGLIKKQDAIDAILGLTNCDTAEKLRAYVKDHDLGSWWSGGVLSSIGKVERLPSAEPKTPQNGSITCVKLEKMHDRPTDDLISRQDVLHELDGCDYELKDWQRWKLKTMVRDIPSAEKAQLSGEDATSICKCPCEYREPCDYCPYHRHGCPAEEGLKDE